MAAVVTKLCLTTKVWIENPTFNVYILLQQNQIYSLLKSLFSRIETRRNMGILQKTNTLSLDTKYKLVIAIDKKTKPKSEIACDFWD